MKTILLIGVLIAAGSAVSGGAAVPSGDDPALEAAYDQAQRLAAPQPEKKKKAKPDVSVQAGQQCRTQADCGAWEHCVNWTCWMNSIGGHECFTDFDCKFGNHCVDQICRGPW